MSRRAVASAVLPLALLLTGPATLAAPGTVPDGWDAPEAIASYSDDLRTDVQATASDGDGYVFASWRVLDHDPPLAQVAVRDPATGTWSEPVTLDDGLVPDQRTFVRLADGRTALVFVGFQPDDDDDWSAGFQVVNTDGTLGPSATHQLPRFYDPSVFAPSVSTSGDIVIALSQYDKPVVLHSAALGPLEQLEVPAPTLRRHEEVVGLLVDPALAVTAIVDRDPRPGRERPGRILVLDLNEGVWTAHVLDNDVTHEPDRVATGRDGNAALTWNSDGRVVVGTRVNGTWTVDRKHRVENCGQGWHSDCGVVAVTDDFEVVATWLRDDKGSAHSTGVIARRDPTTGAWSRPKAFDSDLHPDAWWHLFVGGGGDAIIWWRDGQEDVYQCERGRACKVFGALDAGGYPLYADAPGHEVVTVFEANFNGGNRHSAVHASTYR